MLMHLLAAEPRSSGGLLLPYYRSLSPWNDLNDPVFNGVGVAGFKSSINAFVLALAALSLFAFFCSAPTEQDRREDSC